jgi:hypothetical protein
MEKIHVKKLNQKNDLNFWMTWNGPYFLKFYIIIIFGGFEFVFLVFSGIWEHFCISRHTKRAIAW